jgi:bifunctional polynucleotide phosphatase/kinase
MQNPFKNTFIINELTNDVGSEKIAAFDLENSVIKYKDNTMSVIHGAKNKILKLSEENYKIVFFTQQSTSKFNIENFKEKTKEIKKMLGTNFQLFGCYGSGYSKKPSIGLWKLLEQNNCGIKINLNESFYIGDAVGRSNDVNDHDIKFAINIKIKNYTPDEYFDNCKVKINIPEHPLSLSSDSSQEMDYSVFDKIEKKLVILVGPPSCGKTAWCKQDKFKDYSVIDQEKYKIKSKVVNLMIKELEEGKSVIINKRNELEKDRIGFIEIAKEHGAVPVIVLFDIPKKLCKHICVYREIVDEIEIPSIIISKYYSNNENKKLNDKDAVIIVNKFKIDYSLIKNKELFESHII